MSSIAALIMQILAAYFLLLPLREEAALAIGRSGVVWCETPYLTLGCLQFLHQFSGCRLDSCRHAAAPQALHWLASHHRACCTCGLLITNKAICCPVGSTQCGVHVTLLI